MEAQKFQGLIEKIRSNTYIESRLNLGVDQFFEERFIDRLDDEQAVELAEALKQNTHITKVDLYGNNIGDIGAIALASVLNLEGLNLDLSKVEFKGLAALAKSNLKSLVISFDHMDMDKDPLEELEVTNAFIANKTLINLDLTYGYFSNYFLSELISKNTTIKVLSLPRYTDDETLKFIGNNKTLKELHIRENELTNKGAWYIAGNTSLESLKIDESHIGDDGAAFLTMLPTLKKLTIGDSDITAKGAKVFTYSNLKEFVISGKHEILSNEDARHINLTFRDVRDENGEAQYTKKAKIDHQDVQANHNTEEGLSLLGEGDTSYGLDYSGEEINL